jgi:SAM-dependent methyltransferase
MRQDWFVADATNQCAGGFGAIYDFYISRPWISKPLARVLWGIDVAPMYSLIDRIAEVGWNARLLDIPCGGGLALRALSPGKDVEFIAADIDPKMLARTAKRAARHGLVQVETLATDMRAIDLPDSAIDFACCFSGLHMIDESDVAVRELARVLRPGGELVGSSFTGDGSRRKRWLFEREHRRSGIAVPPADAGALAAMLERAGFVDVTVRGDGFATFTARRA